MRRDDWELRLHDYLAGAADARFGYDHASDPARMDCCVFAAGAVEAITGDDPMAEFRGAYATEAQASAALKKIGAGSLRRTLDRKFPRVPAAFAQRGDLVMHDGSVGVCVGADALFVREDGLARIPRAHWLRRGWKVG